MKVKELDTTDIKSLITTMEEQINNSKNDLKAFLQEYYKDFLEEARTELNKRGENIC